MGRKLPAWLERPLAALRPPGPKARAAADRQRPEGPLLWIRDGAGSDGAGLIARRMAARLPDLHIVVSSAESAAQTDLPDDAIRLPIPEDRPASIRLVFETWRPDLILFLGSELPPVMVAEATRRGVPLVLADVKLGPPGVGLAPEQLGLLARMTRIYLRDTDSRAVLGDRVPEDRVMVCDDALAAPIEPLPCSEAERASMAEAIGARPVWLATSLPRSELVDILAAHRRAMRHAHRLLLLLVPDPEEAGADLARELAEAGWAVARRSLEGEPDATTEIFVADDAQEYGLWYRLAPLSYMGGTLSGAGFSPRSPLEAAALGSAILHGASMGQYRTQYLRLENAKACRGIRDGASLAPLLTELIAPDRAAQLAHNAWAIGSAGAGAVETVSAGVEDLLRARLCPEEE